MPQPRRRASPSVLALAVAAAIASAAGCNSEAIFPDGNGTPPPTQTLEDTRPHALRGFPGLDTVTLSWEPVDGALGYVVQTTAGGIALQSIEMTTGSAGGVTIDLASGETWSIRVLAQLEDGLTRGSGALALAPIARGWSGLVPSTHADAIFIRSVTVSLDYGRAVAGVGDLDGDGFEELAVGAPATSEPGNVPFVYVYRGAAEGLGASVATLSGENGSEFGAAVAGLGDGNGDGFDDLLVGVPNAVVGTNDVGSVFVYRGDAADLVDDTPIFTASGTQNAESFAAALDGVGDVDGDGRADFCVGSPDRNSTTSNSGGWDCWYSQTAGAPYPTNPNINAAGTFSNERFGTEIAGVGDVDGDGGPDMVVVAPRGCYMSMCPGVGEGFLYRDFGPALGVAAVLEGSGTNEGWGEGLDGVGDVDGDGYDDFVIGMPFVTSSVGTARLYRGQPTSPYYTLGAWSPGAALAVGDDNTQFGIEVAGAGDVNADGYADVLVGGPFRGAAGEGALFLYLGGPGGLPDEPSLVVMGVDDVRERLGTGVAAADVNGDGSTDIAATSSDVLTIPGSVVLLYGPPVRGPMLDLGASRTVAAGSVALAGASIAFEGFDDRVECTIEWDNGGAPDVLPECDTAALSAANRLLAIGEHVVRVRARALGYDGLEGEAFVRITAE